MNTLTFKQIKATMTDLYVAYRTRGDRSYFELWGALRSLHNLNLIDDKLFDKIVDFDKQLSYEVAI